MKKLVFWSLIFALILPLHIKAFELPFNFHDFYVNTNLSFNFATNDKHQSRSLIYDVGVLVAPAIGYHFCNGMRIEGEFGYRYNKLQRLRYYGASFHPKGHLETFSGLMNAYYEIPICWCLTPYVGAGIGYAYTRNKVEQSYPFRGENHKSGFAWQVMGGAAYPLCYNLDVGFEYRFFQNTQLSRIQNHAIGSTLRYSF